MRELRRKAYQSPSWRKLRNNFIKQNPCCADCLSKGVVKPAEDIHHIKSPFKNNEVNYALLLDEKNLVQLCKACHAARHNADKRFVSPQQVINKLDELLKD